MPYSGRRLLGGPSCMRLVRLVQTREPPTESGQATCQAEGSERQSLRATRLRSILTSPESLKGGEGTQAVPASPLLRHRYPDGQTRMHEATACSPSPPLSFPSGAGRSLRSLGYAPCGAARGRALRACGPAGRRGLGRGGPCSSPARVTLQACAPIPAARTTLRACATPHHGVVHRARRLREDCAMQHESERATASRMGGWARPYPARTTLRACGTLSVARTTLRACGTPATPRIPTFPAYSRQIPLSFQV